MWVEGTRICCAQCRQQFHAENVLSPIISWSAAAHCVCATNASSAPWSHRRGYRYAKSVLLLSIKFIIRDNFHSYTHARHARHRRARCSIHALIIPGHAAKLGVFAQKWNPRTVCVSVCCVFAICRLDIYLPNVGGWTHECVGVCDNPHRYFIESFASFIQIYQIRGRISHIAGHSCCIYISVCLFETFDTIFKMFHSIAKLSSCEKQKYVNRAQMVGLLCSLKTCFHN